MPERKREKQKVQSCRRPPILESELLKSAQGGVSIIITVYVFEPITV